MIVAGNWKMFTGPEPRALAERLAAIDGVDAIVCPPYTALADCVAAGLTTFAQNVHWDDEGAFTGEIAPPMLTRSASPARSSATRSGASSSARPTRVSLAGRKRRSRPG